GEHELERDEFEQRLTIKDGITGAALPDSTAVVVLDTNITQDLILEGLANDALRFIQDSRKAANLDVSDRIKLTYSASGELANAIIAHQGRIMSDALVLEINAGNATQFETNIEGNKFVIDIEK
ncbi:MAG: DUF5915 domain-containing protein, partial [Alphaproteobacteria bacterium]